jgi:hypothetical protein
VRILIAAYAIGAIVVAVTLLTGSARAADFMFPVFVASSISIATLIVVVLRRRTLRGYVARVRDAVPTVPPGIIDAPDPDVAGLIGELRGLGFTLAGGTDTRLGSAAPIRTWVMTEPTGETWIEVGRAGRPLAVFLSQTADGRFLETRAGRGEPIDHPHLLARAVDGGAADALAAHRATLAGWIGERGPARPVRTFDEFLEVEEDIRRKTGGLRILSYIEHVVDPSIRSWAIAAGVGLVAALVVLARIAIDAR